MGAFRAVPGAYTIATDVGPMERSKCPAGGLYEDNTLCCIEKAGNEWRCRRVSDAPAKAPDKPAPDKPAPDKPDTCLRAIQFYYLNRQQLAYSAVTGAWNPETEAILAARFPNPKAYTGGPCAILAMLGIRPDAPAATGPGIAQQVPGGMLTIAAVGVAALAAIIYATRQPA
jgi:hypothetical protein